MKITQQTSSQLVLHAPASAGCMTGLILAIPGLLLIFFFILPLLGSLNYFSLKCSRNMAKEKNCQFLRISLLQPSYYQFSLNDFQNISIKSRTSRVGSQQEIQYRLHSPNRFLKLSIWLQFRSYT